ncbi:uncharacterized protein LY89DRAFT_672267 [Mollisia scopiformis]|uniref:Uncharacterized protein n=1 Tax=Mollisia scopiformis TaxID=149040 RepID=A0A194X1C7_MOLSC|nr:uncharacterized protein LY89DRAFT_672267 [Mollisia scopiformis]KUJ14000.1 hypothetical protein LY89DRAFT_672267 [Mollisia scopiformis]
MGEEKAFSSQLHIILDLGMTGISVSYINATTKSERFLVTNITSWPCEFRKQSDVIKSDGNAPLDKFPACRTKLGGHVWYGYDSLDKLDEGHVREGEFREGFKTTCLTDCGPEMGDINQWRKDYQDLIAHVLGYVLVVILGNEEVYDASNPSITIHLTKPSSWDQDPEAKSNQYKLVHNAAVQCGIKPSLLTVHQSPELDEGQCSAIAIAHEASEKLVPGSYYLILDLGGYTADFCIVQIGAGNQVDLITSISKNVGTNLIDAALAKLLLERAESESPSSTPHEQLFNPYLSQLDTYLRQALNPKQPINVFFEKVYLTGGGAGIERVADCIETTLHHKGLRSTMNSLQSHVQEKLKDKRNHWIKCDPLVIGYQKSMIHPEIQWLDGVNRLSEDVDCNDPSRKLPKDTYCIAKLEDKRTSLQNFEQYTVSPRQENKYLIIFSSRSRAAPYSMVPK